MFRSKKKRIPIHKFRNVAMQKAADTKGKQATERRYLVDQYRGGPPKRRKKRGK